MPRQPEPERLNLEGDADNAAILRDMEFLNRWLGGRALVRAARRHGSVLDVAAGSGWLARRAPGVTSLDLSPRNLRLAPPPKVAADALQLPFAGASFDAVVSCLFLHHLGDAEIADFLRECNRVARRAIYMMDLQRGWIPEQFLRATRPLFGWHPVFISDGEASVRSAFTASELHDLALRAGLASARVRVLRPWFRLMLSFEK